MLEFRKLSSSNDSNFVCEGNAINSDVTYCYTHGVVDSVIAASEILSRQMQKIKMSVSLDVGKSRPGVYVDTALNHLLMTITCISNPSRRKQRTVCGGQWYGFLLPSDVSRPEINSHSTVLPEYSTLNTRGPNHTFKHYISLLTSTLPYTVR